MRWWKRKNAKRKRTARRIGVVKHDLVSHSSEEVLYTGNEHNSSLQSFEEVSKADNENEKTHPKGVTAHSGCRKKSLPYANHGLAVRPKKGNKTGADSKQPRQRKRSFWSFQVASVLTPATILQPNMHMNDAFSKRFHASGDDFHLRLAAAYINDAISGRGKYGEAKALLKSSWHQNCFKIVSSYWWTMLLYATILVHCLIISWEQPFTPTDIGHQWVPVSFIYPIVYVNCICLIIYGLDIFFHIAFITIEGLLYDKENMHIRVEAVLFLLFVIDYIIFIVEYCLNMRLLCPFRCLRPVMLLLKAKNVFHIYQVLTGILTEIVKMLVMIIVFILVFGAVGVHIFRDSYKNLGCEVAVVNVSDINTTLTNCTMTDVYEGAFGNIWSGWVNMFVLMSTENYPELVIPAYNESPATIIYFILYIFAGVFFLTAILLAIIVENYWAYSYRHVKRERSQRREQLVKAWNLIDPLGYGEISVYDEQLKALFRILKPQNTDDENQHMINFLSGGDDEDVVDVIIDAYDWTVRLPEALSFEFDHGSSKYNCCGIVGCLSGDEQQEDGVKSWSWLTSKKYYQFHTVMTLVFILIHTIFFMAMWDGISDHQQLGIQSARTAINIAFLLQIIMRLLQGQYRFSSITDTLDMIMVVIAMCGCIAWYILWFATPAENKDRAFDQNLGICVVVTSIAVIHRLVFNWKHAKEAIDVLRCIIPVMLDLIWLVAVIMYLYAVLGFELFQASTTEKSSERGFYGSYSDYNCGVGFDTFWCSFLIVIQIVVTNDWHQIMQGATMDFAVPVIAQIYFLSCFIIIVMIVMNLFVAISIEAYKKLPGGRKNNKPSDDTTEILDEGNKQLSKRIKGKLSRLFESTKPHNKPQQQTGIKRKISIALRPPMDLDTTLTPIQSPVTEHKPFPLTSLDVGSSNRPPSGDVFSVTSDYDIGFQPPKRNSRGNSMASSISHSTANSRSTASIEQVEIAAVREMRSSTTEQKLKERQKQQRMERNKRKNMRVEKDKQLQQTPVLQPGSKWRQLQDRKMSVRVIEGFKANTYKEMSVEPGQILDVKEVNNEMALGPMGWFPLKNAVPMPESPVIQKMESTHDLHCRQTRPNYIAAQSPKVGKKMRRKTDASDWRKNIHGEMTVMNKDEYQRLSNMLRGGMERRHTQHERPAALPSSSGNFSPSSGRQGILKKTSVSLPMSPLAEESSNQYGGDHFEPNSSTKTRVLFEDDVNYNSSNNNPSPKKSRSTVTNPMITIREEHQEEDDAEEEDVFHGESSKQNGDFLTVQQPTRQKKKTKG